MKNYVDLPHKRFIQDYQRAQEELIGTVQLYPDVVAVYTAGTVSQPGISDLDFVLCLKDILRYPLDLEKKISSLTRELIGRGTILKVNEANISSIKIIDDFPIHHIWGRNYEFTEYSGDTFTVCRVLDWLPERIWTAGQAAAAPTLSATWALQLIKSLGVSLQGVQRLMGTANCDSFIQRTRLLREEWFNVLSSTALSELDHLLAEGAVVGGLALDDFSQWLTEEALVSPMTWPIDVVWHVQGGPTFRLGHQTAFGNGQQLEVPAPILTYLWAQGAVSTGYISACVRNSFSAAPSHIVEALSAELAAVLRQRMRYVESLAQFFKNNKLRIGLLKFGWYLRSYE